MNSLLSIDYALFEFFNATVANPFFDWLMPIITDSDNLLMVMIGGNLLYLILSKNKKRAFGFILLSLLVFTITDMTAYRILKEFFGRVRPCNPSYFHDGVHGFLQNAHFLRGMKNSFSLPSNHAANAFGIFVFWTLLYPGKGKWLIPAAILISYTRVYVGVHYPFDITLGGIWGTACAMFVYLLFDFFRRRKYGAEITVSR